MSVPVVREIERFLFRCVRTGGGWVGHVCGMVWMEGGVWLRCVREIERFLFRWVVWCVDGRRVCSGCGCCALAVLETLNAAYCPSPLCCLQARSCYHAPAHRPANTISTHFLSAGLACRTERATMQLST